MSADTLRHKQWLWIKTLWHSVLSSVDNQEATPILSEVRSSAWFLSRLYHFEAMSKVICDCFEVEKGRRVTTMMEIMVILSRAESGNFRGSFVLLRPSELKSSILEQEE